MIIINLKGGLGNQMFQYACGKALFLRNRSKGYEEELKLDVTGYERLKDIETPRFYSLDAFNINVPFATTKEILAVKYPFGIVSKAWRYFRAKVLRKFYTDFIPSVLDWRGDVYLDGFWQTERYFKDFEKDIRSDFVLKKALGPAAEEWRKKISHDPHSVSLHVRRGDYVTDERTNLHHGTCDKDYYERAVKKIAQFVPRPNIYVFSDDIAWAKENLAFGFPTFFVSAPPKIADPEELYLMSLCKHNITANSSFSWWGAWLNENPDKIVIAPAKWTVKHDEKHHADIIPKTWIRL